MALADVDTPALLVDLDAFEANIATMARKAAAAGAALRPHAKTHKCAEIARRQLAAGAKGICCQKVSEAEALLPSGVEDVLISNQIVGPAKLRRLAKLARAVRVTTCVAYPAQAAALSEAAAQEGIEISVLIEIDVGDSRMGLRDPETVMALAGQVEALPGLRFRGFQAYSGPLQHTRSFERRKAEAERGAHIAAQMRERVEDSGLSVDIVTGGGTGSFEFDLASGTFNEIQPGSYVFMDRDYERNEYADGGPFRPFQQSLFVLATVMSGPWSSWAYLDAGAKAVNNDCGFPGVRDRPGLAYVRASDEHGRIEAAPGLEPPGLGERLMLVPGHCDPTVNLHDWIVAVRRGAVEAVWPIEARGALF
jgi:D-serine deaminase-like pyridoxal phosphate-dependent protein